MKAWSPATNTRLGSPAPDLTTTRSDSGKTKIVTAATYRIARSYWSFQGWMPHAVTFFRDGLTLLSRWPLQRFKFWEEYDVNGFRKWTREWQVNSHAQQISGLDGED
ncbi:MAG: hypothetical protein Q9202_007185 [Teloschistes flavicans]